MEYFSSTLADSCSSSQAILAFHEAQPSITLLYLNTGAIDPVLHHRNTVHTLIPYFCKFLLHLFLDLLSYLHIRIF
jgi:hypothetical protein